jgi:hypothetical protein
MDGLTQAAHLEHCGIYYLDFLGMLNRQLSPRTYFEIGTDTGASLERFSCDAVCVDPTFRVERNVWAPRRRSFLFQMTSDDFFRDEDLRLYFPKGPDIAFLDGMHLFEYLLRDFINVERLCHPRSLVLLHDCLPLSARMAERAYRGGDEDEGVYQWAWTGDVWKILYAFHRFRPDLLVSYIDCPPTGLVAVRRLDPSSTVLSAGYEEVAAEVGRIELDKPGLAELWSLYPTFNSRALDTASHNLSAVFSCR